MSAVNTLVATIDANHTITLPDSLSVGERVLVVPISSIDTLLSDTDRRTRFAATRKAIQAAMQNTPASQAPSDEEIVQLVKRARHATNSQ